MDEKPIVEKPFKTSTLVICGKCKGDGVLRDFDGEEYDCPTCMGSGKLYRNTEGVVTIYRTNHLITHN